MRSLTTLVPYGPHVQVGRVRGSGRAGCPKGATAAPTQAHGYHRRHCCTASAAPPYHRGCGRTHCSCLLRCGRAGGCPPRAASLHVSIGAPSRQPSWLRRRTMGRRGLPRGRRCRSRSRVATSWLRAMILMRRVAATRADAASISIKRCSTAASRLRECSSRCGAVGGHPTAARLTLRACAMACALLHRTIVAAGAC